MSKLRRVEGDQQAIVDTGANINAVTRDLVSHLKIEPYEIECVALANNDREVPLGDCSYGIRIYGY